MLGHLCNGCYYFRQSQFAVPCTYYNLVELGTVLQESDCDGVVETPSIIHLVFESPFPTLGRGPSSIIVLYVSLSPWKHILSTDKAYIFRLEVFNSVIYLHLSENSNLIYGILSSHKKFEDLGTFTLAKGLREVRQAQLAREEQARRLDSHDEASGDAPNASREKARLSENDSLNDIATPTRSEVGTPRSAARDDQVEVTTRSTTPSTTGATSQHNDEHSLTEKARGKMKERCSSSLDMSPDLERLAAAGIGRNGFVPTQEWVSNFEHLPAVHTMIYSTRSHLGNRGNVISMPSD